MHLCMSPWNYQIWAKSIARSTRHSNKDYFPKCYWIDPHRGNEVYDNLLQSSEALVLNGNIDGFTVINNVHDNNNIGYDFIGYRCYCFRRYHRHNDVVNLPPARFSRQKARQGEQYTPGAKRDKMVDRSMGGITGFLTMMLATPVGAPLVLASLGPCEQATIKRVVTGLARTYFQGQRFAIYNKA